MDGKIYVKTESVKDGKEESFDADVVLVSVGRRPYTEGLNLEKVGVELDNKGRIVIDSQFNTTVQGIRCIGDVTFGPMLAHKAEEEGKQTLKEHPLLCQRRGHGNHAQLLCRHRCRGVPEDGSRPCELQRHPVGRVYASRGRMGWEE